MCQGASFARAGRMMMTEQPPSQPYQPPPAPPPPTYPPPTSYQPPRRSPAWQWGCGIGLAGCLLATMLGILLLLGAVMAAVGGIDGFESAGEHVALIRIEGVIVAGQSGFSFLGGAATGSDDIVEQLDEAIEDENAKAILLRINSPGGSAAGAQETYSAIKRATEAGKPVVVSMADVAASGGYYVAAPAMSGLFDKLGIDAEVIKSGELKDMFNPTEPLSPEAREVVTALVEEVFGQFVTAVAEGRGMAEADVLALADGRIYTGQQAIDNGLIDQLGGMHEALAEAGSRAGIKGKPEMRQYGAPSFLRWLFGDSSAKQRSVTVTGGLLYDGFAARFVCGTLWPEDAAAPALEPRER